MLHAVKQRLGRCSRTAMTCTGEWVLTEKSVDAVLHNDSHPSSDSLAAWLVVNVGCVSVLV